MYNKQYKQQCQQCGKYGHKPGDWRCPECSNKKEENKKKNEYKNKKFECICYHCGQKGHISEDCRALRNNSYKKFEKAERAVDRDGDELVLCSLMRDIKKKKIMKRKKFGSQIMSNSLRRLV